MITFVLKPRWCTKLKAQYRKEGQLACDAGKPSSSCPYPLNTPERDLWNQGHYNAGEGLKRFIKELSLIDDLI